MERKSYLNRKKPLDHSAVGVMKRFRQKVLEVYGAFFDDPDQYKKGVLDGTVPLEQRRAARYRELQTQEYIKRELFSLRQQRLQELWKIDSLGRDLEDFSLDDLLETELEIGEQTVTFKLQDYIRTDFRHKSLDSSLKDELSGIVADIRYEFDSLHPTLFELATTPIFSQIADKLRIRKIKSYLKKRFAKDFTEEELELISTQLSQVFDEFEVDDEGNNMPDNISNEAIAKYLENYTSFIFIGSHNKEVVDREIESSYLNSQSSDIEGPSSNLKENSVKSSSSIQKKEAQGTRVQDMDDLYRDTIIVDRLFDQIDYFKLVQDCSSDEEYQAKLIELKSAIFGRYLSYFCNRLKQDGFTISEDTKFKVYGTGYTDCTIKVKNQQGKTSEIQLQTAKTFDVKKEETLEFEKRKQIKKDLLDLVNQKLSRQPNSDTRGDLEKILATFDDEERLVKISNLLEEFYNSTDENIAAEINNESIDLVRQYFESIATSQAWFAVDSFVQDKTGFLRVMKYVDEDLQNNFAYRGNKTIIPETIKSTFNEYRNVGVRVFWLNQNGELLLLQKSDESSNPNAFELPGGKLQHLNALPFGSLREDLEEAIFTSATAALYEEVGGNPGPYVAVCNPLKLKNPELPFTYLIPKKEYNFQPSLVHYVCGKIPEGFRINLGSMPDNDQKSKHSKKYKFLSFKVWLDMLAKREEEFNGNSRPPDSMLYKLYKAISSV